jgi:hypothetical protein
MLGSTLSLLRDIQDNAVGKDASVEVLLRQCVLLASRLQHAPLREWANLELKGYPDEVPLPEYRPKIGTQVLGDFAGPMGSGAKNVGLPPAAIPDQFEFAKEHLFTAQVRQGVSEIENLLASGETSFSVPWPMNFVAALQGCFYAHMNLMSARQIIPATVMSSTLSGIRDGVLQFALDIERENPEAGEAAPGDAPISEQRVTQIFNQHFHGDHTTFAAAGRDVAQAVHTSIDIAGLEAALRGLEIANEDREALVVAVREDESDGSAPGPRVHAWMEKLRDGGIQLGSGVAIGTAADLLAKLLGA